MAMMKGGWTGNRYCSRTRDPMVQAARSGVQNIAEGRQASGSATGRRKQAEQDRSRSNEFLLVCRNQNSNISELRLFFVFTVACGASGGDRSHPPSGHPDKIEPLPQRTVEQADAAAFAYRLHRQDPVGVIVIDPSRLPALL